jgi:hypothetical protein
MSNKHVSSNQPHLREIIGKPGNRRFTVSDFLICIVASAKVLFKLIKRKVVGVG